ncbi:MAG: class I SAM-dependent methyltransferase [Rudaea sp.]
MQPTETQIRTAHPNGHFYSPVVDPSQIVTARVWPNTPHVLGVDFDEQRHLDILSAVFPRHIADYDYPERLDEAAELVQFYTQNSQFSWLDSRALFVLLREWKPKRFIEVGSGFSTLLVADINRRYFDEAMFVMCIEPFPREFLKKKIAGVSRLIEQKVQEVPLAEFEALESGDVLFIDSSHVAKTGSDVNFLYFEVLPRLASGVYIHVHDIFLPHDYPQEWVIAENRSWNEQYLLRALLMYSTAFRVEFGCNYAVSRFPDEVRAALANGHCYGGGSIWLRKN